MKPTQTLMVLVLACALAAGCHTIAQRDAAVEPSDSARNEIDRLAANPEEGLLFSRHLPLAPLPASWLALSFPNKAQTEYSLVWEQDRTALRARASNSVSLLRKTVSIQPQERPWLSWSWKVTHLLAEADNTQRSKEDAPVRVVLAFEGDHSKLSFRDQMLNQQSKLLTGREMPYATLMYIWENRQPVGSVIDNPHTGRIKMVVAASGTSGLGRWMKLSRNIEADYRRAFGEAPGKLVSIGLMTDTDNTGGQVVSYYGDVRVHR